MLQLAGPLDEGFAARCASHALLHVAADEVLAAELDPLPPQEPSPEIPEFRAARIHARSPLERSLALARRAVDGLSVTIDGRALIETLAGTQIHTLELIAALHRTGAAELRVVLPPNVGETALALLRSLDGVELLDANDVDEDLPRSTVVHRPYQVSGPEDLGVLWQLGERLVVTHQDLLNYHDPAYHRDREGWLAHRRLTREALATADAVVTFSPHAAADLRRGGPGPARPSPDDPDRRRPHPLRARAGAARARRSRGDRRPAVPPVHRLGPVPQEPPLRARAARAAARGPRLGRRAGARRPARGVGRLGRRRARVPRRAARAR